jgi:peptidoglycan/xylan/chitin deacetylase (PgdA/CDA1 family)
MGFLFFFTVNLRGGRLSNSGFHTLHLQNNGIYCRMRSGKILNKKFSFIILVLILSLVSATTAGAGATRLPVILYHHVLPSADGDAYQNNGLVISQELFAKHMAYLYDNGFHTVTSDELRGFLFNHEALPAKSVLITFDDGYMSNYMFAYPILKQYGFHAILFAITGGIQTKDQDYHKDKLDMLSWMQLEAARDVFEYGSHTNALHYETGSGATGLVSVPLEQAKDDISLSLSRLNNTSLFSYPEGQYNKQIVDMLPSLGVDLAFTINKGYVTTSSNPLKLNRITIYSDFSVSLFSQVVNGEYIY